MNVRPDYKRIKPIIRRLYGVSLLDETQRKFWGWISNYYLCSLGEVMRVALPSLVKGVTIATPTPLKSFIYISFFILLYL